MFDKKVPIRLEVTHEMLNDLARRGLNAADILAVVTGKFDSDMHFARIAELIERDARPSTSKQEDGAICGAALGDGRGLFVCGTEETWRETGALRLPKRIRVRIGVSTKPKHRKTSTGAACSPACGVENGFELE